jgi:hypothetical protein
MTAAGEAPVGPPGPARASMTVPAPAAGVLRDTGGMPELIGEPARVAAAGAPPKLIDEYVGRASTGGTALSIARMRSPAGWAEPGQRPEFDEFTIVLRGALVVEFDGGQMTVGAGGRTCQAGRMGALQHTGRWRGVHLRLPAGLRPRHGPPR